MEVKYFFNVLLLSISLATIFMTLVTYIIFKFRYSMKTKSSDGTVNLEGSFFRRYAPHLSRKNNEILTMKELKKKSPKQRRKKLVWTYGGVTLIIFTFFLLENHLSFRRELMDRVSEAERYKQLLQQGLLAKHEFNPNFKFSSFDEKIGNNLINYKRNLLSILKNEKIFIVRLSNNRNEYLFETSLKSWTNFLKRNELNWKYTGTSFQDEGIYILPQLNILTDGQLSNVKKAILNPNIKIFATGALGKMNLNKTPRKEWVGENISKLVENKKLSEFYPTKIKGFGPVPPGLQLNWVPLDNSVKFEKGIAGDLIESSYDGIPNMDETGYRTKPFNPRALQYNDSTLLTLLDPLSPSDQNKNDIEYSDTWILTKLADFSGAAYATVPVWRYSAIDSVFAIAIDTEDQFSRLEELTDIFTSYEIPATIFLVTDLMKDNMSQVRDLPNYIELASHTTSHKNLKGRNSSDVFNDLQLSRHAIEEFSLQKVIGIRPPEETLDNASLSPIFQNGLEYIFSDQSFFRYSPLLLTNEELVIIPRVVPDDSNIKNNRILSTPEIVNNYMRSHFEHVKSLNGAFFFSVHTHIFTSSVALKALDMFISNVLQSSKTTSFWTLAATSTWWKLKSNLETKFYESPTTKLEILNNASFDSGEFEVNIHAGSSSLEKCNEGIDQFKARKSSKGYIVKIDNIKASEKLIKEVCLN
ncbi:MAG: hypothetical protein EP319_14925 [Deltaproteobacteria bacterium]|nr:MAG: hypothetical protein EP319_14925 [Deltaproteobacteria bacterium]